MQNSTAVRTRQRQKTLTHSREIPWSFMLLVVVCACVVAAGFFFAARQHFTSMEYGIKNSKLREQLDNLESEKRRLMLAREVALSPLAVRKAAREIGLREVTEEIVAVPATKKIEAAPIEGAPVKVAQAKNDTAPTVVRTVLALPAHSKSNGETRGRVVEAKKDKKEKVEVATLLKFK